MNKEYKKQVKLVYKDDMLEFLDALGAYNSFLDNSSQCWACGHYVDESNLHSILYNQKAVTFFCSDPDCLLQFFTYDVKYVTFTDSKDESGQTETLDMGFVVRRD